MTDLKPYLTLESAPIVKPFWLEGQIPRKTMAKTKMTQSNEWNFLSEEHTDKTKLSLIGTLEKLICLNYEIAHD